MLCSPPTDLDPKYWDFSKESKQEGNDKEGASSDSDEDGSSGEKTKHPIESPSTTILNKILEKIANVEDRLVRIEGKTDNIQDMVYDVKRDVKYTGGRGRCY